MNEQRDAASLRSYGLRRIRFILATLCIVVYLGMLVGLAGMVREDPLRPLHQVGFTALLVTFMFALCLVSVIVFTRMRDAESHRRGVQS